MNQQIRWSAQLKHVREVSLIGTASLAYWQTRLREENLSPAADNGHATILIVAATGTFMRFSFCELSISVRIDQHTRKSDNQTYFLIQAFNSNRFFAFCERTLFATPYEHAAVSVEHNLPAAVRVTRRFEPLLSVSMSGQDNATSRKPAHESHEAINARLLLPGRNREPHAAPKMFFARISGYTRSYPFERDRDTIAIADSPDVEGCSTLTASDFAPTTWVIRTDANHAKSKTYSSGDFQ